MPGMRGAREPPLLHQRRVAMGRPGVHQQVPYMRTFFINRMVDISGVSGTGRVAEGVVFSDGQCIVRWLTATPSTNIYRTVEEMLSIHGHEGSTAIEFLT